MAKKKKQQKDLYFFYSNGCVYCSKMEPVIDEFIKEGHNILKLNISEKDNQGLKNEITDKYGKNCGTPWLVDPETGHQVCGFGAKDVVQKWLDGEDIPSPPVPKGQMPRPPFGNASEEEVKSWKKQYEEWAKDNSHLTDIKSAEDLLAMPRPNSMPPNPPRPGASDAEMKDWTDKYDVWYEENKHLPNIKNSADVLKIFEERKQQLLNQQNVDKVDTKLEVTQLRVELNEMKAQLDSMLRHFGVPHTPLWKRKQDLKSSTKDTK
tara:strand:+ start:714 stop:1505 length:792 start_codon:yes stop_codon:yes gene_type:complete